MGTIEEALDATTTNDMSLLELLTYYLKPHQYCLDEVTVEDAVKDIRAIAAILLDGETP